MGDRRRESSAARLLAVKNVLATSGGADSFRRMSDHMPSDLAAVETPALVVDLDRLDANLARAADYAASHGLALGRT